MKITKLRTQVVHLPIDPPILTPSTKAASGHATALRAGWCRSISAKSASS